MKLFKFIMVVAISILLVLSVALNIFVFTIFEINDTESFKQVLLCRELVESLNQLSNPTVDTTVDETTDEIVSDSANTEAEPETEPETEAPVETATKNSIIYEDSNVKITYVKQELSLLGPTLKFCVENKTTEAIDVSFNDVYIDGYMVDFCSIYVNALAGNRQSFENLYIYESDYKDFTAFPSMVEFTIKVKDTETWYDLAESEPIYININK